MPITAPNFCIVPSCNKRARGAAASMCEMHYYRVRRTGKSDDPALLPNGTRRLRSHGYVSVLLRGHPLADAQGYVYEHRALLFDRFGEGPLPCHHCGVVFPWSKIEGDHLNFDRSDNDQANVVPSCGPCNRRRSFPNMIATMQARAARIEFAGESLTYREWSERLGITVQAFKNRLEKWPFEKAMTTPRGLTGPRTDRDHRRILDKMGQLRFFQECNR